MESTFLGIKEAACLLNLTHQQVRNLCRSNKLIAEKIGNAWILEKSVVELYKGGNNCGLTIDKPIKGNIESEKKPISLSFFTGAMGLDLGIEKAGFKTLLACETDNACRKTIVKNKPNIALIGDIRGYSAEEIRGKAGLKETDKIDLIIGGPPCQAFSTAGNRKGFEDDRGNVFLTFLDRIIALQPQYAVIENVRGILSASYNGLKGGALMHIIKKLENAGYAVNFNLYNAANFGVPQKRERVIIIASKGKNKMPYLTPTNSEHADFGLPRWTTFKDAVRGLSKKKHNYILFPEKRLKYYRLLGPGQYWKNLPIQIQKEALGKSYYSGGGKTGFLRRLAWNEPSPTLVTHPAMPATDLAHPEENRPLSIEEYKRIQQFPDSWKIEGSLIEQYRQIGNAVPIGLGEAVGKLIMSHIKGDTATEPALMDFKYSRYSNTNEITWMEEITKTQLKLKRTAS